jgi:two-component system LytT family response regulator/two-component system response regulator AlgR
MNPLRVAVAEDEPLNRERLVRLLGEAGCEVVGAFPSGSDLLAWLGQGGAVDALFLDIRMPGPSGLDVAADLPPDLPVVFVTAHADHAIQAFEAAAVDYLLKPVRAERLRGCLDRLQARRRAPVSKPLTRYAVKAGEGLVFLDLGRTTHFEVEDEVVFAHAGGRFQTTWRTLAEVEAAFPQAGLLRIHRHLLLRPEVVVGLRPAEGGRVKVTLPGGVELEASRPMTPKLKLRLGLA